MRTLSRSLWMALTLLALTVAGVQAGGWAVITVDELPASIVAGQPFTIGFMVRQHGRTPRSDLEPIARFTRRDTRDSINFTARREGGDGHYVAEVKLPAWGQWNWKIDIESFGMVTQEMAPLTVLAAAPAAAPAAASEFLPVEVSAPAANVASLAAGLGGVVVALGALLFWLRTRARPAVAVVAVAVLIGVIGFATAGASVAQPGPSAEPQVAAPIKAAGALTVDLAARGQALFIDKGCAMCHSHAAVKTEHGPFWIGDEPPKLINGKYSAAYLRLWLKEPSTIKPDTVMPDLQLSDAEIEALSAFLDAH